MVELPEEFLKRMHSILGDEYNDFLQSYSRKPYKAVRVNTLKLSVEEFKNISPFSLSPVGWDEYGFYVEEEQAGKTLEHAAGLYYVQEPSAMSVAPLLKAASGERVLDMCSAPGGKGTRLAQDMCGGGVVFLNEIDHSRCKILSQNVERMGITNAVVTCLTPEEIAERYEDYFDKILVDAPCSGEGMFLKEESAAKCWNLKNVASCAERQSKILGCAQRALRGGGLLLYSTCTFAPEEDERQVEEFLSRNKNFNLIEMRKLLPHKIKGEGHFFALMQKTDGGNGAVPQLKLKADKKAVKLWRDFEEQYLNITYNNLHTVKNNLYSVPDACPGLPREANIMRVGVRLCEIREDRVEPSHSLAMALKCTQAKNTLCLDSDEAYSYLRGLTLDCPPKLSGWALAAYRDYPLGWCKCVNGTAKNHLPKGLRI